MERIAILCPEVREHPALSPFFSIPEKANKRVKRVNSQALALSTWGLLNQEAFAIVCLTPGI